MTRREIMIALTASASLSSGTETNLTPEAIFSSPLFRGQIKASEAALLMQQQKMSEPQLMVSLLPAAKKLAHPPLSNFFVGAVALGKSGNLYVGANIEIPGNMLGLAVHAEQAAVANAYMSEEPGIAAIAVTAAPCGHCRQFLRELSIDEDMQVLIDGAPLTTLSELLPRAFGPKDLGFNHGALPVVRTQMMLTGASEPLALEATKAAQLAYSPYSQSPSGVALQTSNGRVFSGSYIENAAFNPSLPPLEAALAGFFAAGTNAGSITRAVLVEKAGNKISHQVTTKSALAFLAPAALVEFRTAS